MEIEFRELSAENLKSYSGSLQKLARKIWEENFLRFLSDDQLDYMLSMMYAEEKIREELQSDVHWYLVYRESALIGYFSIKPEADSMFISKLYLDSSYHGRGIASRLLYYIESFAKDHNKSLLTLRVNRNNMQALSFYKKNGFRIVEESMVDIGNGYVMDDYVMEKSHLL